MTKSNEINREIGRGETRPRDFATRDGKEGIAQISISRHGGFHMDPEIMVNVAGAEIPLSEAKAQEKVLRLMRDTDDPAISAFYEAEQKDRHANLIAAISVAEDGGVSIIAPAFVTEIQPEGSLHESFTDSIAETLDQLYEARGIEPVEGVTEIKINLIVTRSGGSWIVTPKATAASMSDAEKATAKAEREAKAREDDARRAVKRAASNADSSLKAASREAAILLSSAPEGAKVDARYLLSSHIAFYLAYAAKAGINVAEDVAAIKRDKVRAIIAEAIKATVKEAEEEQESETE